MLAVSAANGFAAAPGVAVMNPEKSPVPVAGAAVAAGVAVDAAAAPKRDGAGVVELGAPKTGAVAGLAVDEKRDPRGC